MSSTPSSPAAAPAARPGQAGFALITILMILVMLTLLAVSMYRGFGLQEKIAGNTREKERAFQGAQNTLAFGEWLLLNGVPATGTTCTGTTTVSTVDNMRVCVAALTNPGDPDAWTTAQTYTPPNMKVLLGGGGTIDPTDPTDTEPALTDMKDINYADTPKLYVNYLGLSADGKQALYGVTAAGYGGTGSTRAVVQSVYALSASTTSLDQP